MILATLGVAVVAALVAVTGGSAKSTGGPYVIGVSNGYYGNAARVEYQAALKAYAATPSVKPKIKKLVINNAGTSVAKQIQAVDAMIAQHVNAIILDSNSLDGLNPAIAAANKAGIPVVAVNDKVSSKLAYNIETVGQRFGQTMASGIVKMLHGKGNIVELRGIAGNAVDAAEAAGWASVLKNNPGIKVLNVSYGQWDDAQAQKIMSDLLSRYDNIDGVLTEGGMQQGVVRAYVAAHQKFVPVTGTDENGFACQVKQYHSQGLQGVQVGTGIYAYALALKVALQRLDTGNAPKFTPLTWTWWDTQQSMKQCNTKVSPSLFLQVSDPKHGINLTAAQVDKYMH